MMRDKFQLSRSFLKRGLSFCLLTMSLGLFLPTSDASAGSFTIRRGSITVTIDGKVEPFSQENDYYEKPSYYSPRNRRHHGEFQRRNRYIRLRPRMRDRFHQGSPRQNQPHRRRRLNPNDNRDRYYHCHRGNRPHLSCR